jgi:hypothetical protein
MLSYREYDNAQAVEIVLAGRVSTEEFDSDQTRNLHRAAWPCARTRDRQGFRGHGRHCLLARHQIQFAPCEGRQPGGDRLHPDTHHLWSSLVAPFMGCAVEHFSPGKIEAARDWLMWPEGAAD